jgi:hypothetical protein
MDIQKQIEYFKSLSYEIKKAKVVNMLKQLQDTHETFAVFYTTVTSLSNISDKILLYLYQSILGIAEEIDVGRKDEAQDKIKKMAEVLIKIRRQEQLERQHEGNPDDVLKSM